MNTKVIMSTSALFLALAGACCIFAPHELLRWLGSDNKGLMPVVAQITGALYFSFAMINWTAKANLIGGIYSRAISIGNLTHFFIGTLTFFKAALESPDSAFLWTGSAFYCLFLGCFGFIFFTHPVKNSA